MSNFLIETLILRKERRRMKSSPQSLINVLSHLYVATNVNVRVLLFNQVTDFGRLLHYQILNIGLQLGGDEKMEIKNKQLP